VVAEEVGQLLGADGPGLVRYEPDGQAVVVESWSRAGAHPVAPGSIVELDSDTGVGLVYRTGQAGRCEHFEGREGSMAKRLKEFGYWLTGTAGSSARIYYERAHSDPSGAQLAPSTVPTAVAVFPHWRP
jgi:hypothetical protein